MDSVRNRLIQICEEQLGKLDWDEDGDKDWGDLGADSLNTVEIVMETEEEFDITINDEDSETMRTFNQLVEYVERKI